MYVDVLLFIDGQWTKAESGETLPIVNPATGQELARLAHARLPDLDKALVSTQRAFQAWRRVSAFERSKVLRKAADLMRERADEIARLMTQEQGKPFAEARIETVASADIIDWFAEEGRRAYGRIVPARLPGVHQLVIKEPVGPVAAFTPWNFPISQSVRKAAAAMAAGCSIILKGPEEAPASCAAMVQAFADAGLPDGVLNLVFGTPSEISAYLIPHPVIRKISFTGSTAVGKKLAALAGEHMKRVTMELGGHAPAIIFEDADIEAAVSILAANKFRNAGQVCIAPTRFLIQEPVYERFVDRFVQTAEALRLGNGLAEGTTMGPLAHARRVDAIETLVEDAKAKGGKVRTGGRRVGNEGYFYAPTILTDVPLEARAMNEEPFGPVALMRPFKAFEEAISEANRLPYGLAAYAYTRSAATAQGLGAGIESGMISINHHGLALPENPFGGIKDSGYGSEGGLEAMEAYLATKFVSQANAQA